MLTRSKLFMQLAVVMALSGMVLESLQVRCARSRRLLRSAPDDGQATRAVLKPCACYMHAAARRPCFACAAACALKNSTALISHAAAPDRCGIDLDAVAYPQRSTGRAYATHVQDLLFNYLELTLGFGAREQAQVIVLLGLSALLVQARAGPGVVRFVQLVVQRGAIILTGIEETPRACVGAATLCCRELRKCRRRASVSVTDCPACSAAF